GVATSMPDTGAISKAAEYNNYKRNGGQYTQSQTVTNNNNYTDPELKEGIRVLANDISELKTYLSDPNNRRAYISNDVQKEHDEEMRILDEINTMR
ncbi:MAG: hypothetical protein ACOCQ4_03335, partial [bacterium]